MGKKLILNTGDFSSISTGQRGVTFNDLQNMVVLNNCRHNTGNTTYPDFKISSASNYCLAVVPANNTIDDEDIPYVETSSYSSRSIPFCKQFKPIRVEGAKACAVIMNMSWLTAHSGGLTITLVGRNSIGSSLFTRNVKQFGSFSGYYFDLTQYDEPCYLLVSPYANSSYPIADETLDTLGLRISVYF